MPAIPSYATLFGVTCRRRQAGRVGSSGKPTGAVERPLHIRLHRRVCRWQVAGCGLPQRHRLVAATTDGAGVSEKGSAVSQIGYAGPGVPGIICGVQEGNAEWCLASQRRVG